MYIHIFSFANLLRLHNDTCMNVFRVGHLVLFSANQLLLSFLLVAFPPSFHGSLFLLIQTSVIGMEYCLSMNKRSRDEGREEKGTQCMKSFHGIELYEIIRSHRWVTILQYHLRNWTCWYKNLMTEKKRRKSISGALQWSTILYWTTNIVLELQSSCLIILLEQTPWPKATQGLNESFPWGKSRQELQQGVKAETMQKCCLLSCSEAYANLTLLCSPGLCMCPGNSAACSSLGLPGSINDKDNTSQTCSQANMKWSVPQMRISSPLLLSCTKWAVKAN